MVLDCRKAAWKIFTKENNITIKVDALKHLEEFLSRFGAIRTEQDLDSSLRFILNSFKDQRRGKIVERADLASILESLHSNATGIRFLEAGDASGIDLLHYVSVIGAFEVPRYEFCPGTRSFRVCPSEGSLDASGRTELFRQRYHILLDRVLRGGTFSKDSGAPHDFVLSTVAHLQGSDPEETKVLFGLLSQLKEGVYHLEDLDGSIQLDLADASCSTGVFTENSFVILDGCLTPEGTFKVSSLGLPPVEPSSVTRKSYGQIDFWRAAGSFSEDAELLRSIEGRLGDLELIVLFDFWLDDPKVVGKFHNLLDVLQTKLAGPGHFSTVSIVVGGPFLRDYPTRLDPKSAPDLREKLEGFLSHIDSQYPALMQKLLLVFVPSHEDPYPSLLLPKPALPSVGKRFAHLNASFTTNPSRIRLFTKEIVLFRDDLMSRMQRNCIVLPAAGKYEEHMVQSVLNQAHLSPFPLHVRPVNWNYEHALRLFPVPDMLVVFDNCEPYVLNHAGCVCVNPGSFSKNDFTYLSCFPLAGRASFNKVA